LSDAKARKREETACLGRIFKLFLGTIPWLAHCGCDTNRTAFDEPCLGATIIKEPADVSFRNVLRDVTLDVHQRLHRHDGFAAIQNGLIDRAAYRRLLIRLYGFYVPFEAAAAVADDRSAWLADDLETLGVDSAALSRVALCPDIPPLMSAEARLGALYVVEGSALGGRDLGRNLARLFEAEGVAGRRFFLGRGAGTGEAWREYLTRLSQGASDPAARPKITHAALETFAVFEGWMAGWSRARHD
jgi:heme oxygenase